MRGSKRESALPTGGMCCFARKQEGVGTADRLFTNAFWGCACSAIVVAFYKYGNADPSISMQQAVTLIWLQQIAYRNMLKRQRRCIR